MKKLLARAVMVSLIVVASQPGYAWKMFSIDAASPGLLGNSFVEILLHEGILWTASGRGLGASADSGRTWVTYTTSSGLNSNDPSALFGRPGQIWVAGSHFQMYQGVNYPFGDGFNISTDGGATWSSVKPPEASGFAHLAYDIAGDDSSTYAACFYGGLIVSHDFDSTWSHLFYSPSDSADWLPDQWADLETGRYYACAVDTFHGDTSLVWGGTARGVQKFYYLPKQVKLGGNQIFDMVSDGATLYLAHEGGVTRTDTAVSYFVTTDASNGLAGDWVKRLTLFGGKLWAGSFNPSDSAGLGLYVSSDSGKAWSQEAAGLFTGAGTGVYDFKAYFDSVLYVAAGDSGVYRSLDTGRTWSRFFVDSSDMDFTSPRNRIYSIDVGHDTLYLGTDAGLLKAAYTAPFMITFDSLLTFPENDSSGSSVNLVRHKDDSNAYTWIGVKPQTDSGKANAYFAFAIDSLDTSFMIPFFTPSNNGTVVYNVIFSDSTTIIATSNGLFYFNNYTRAKSEFLVNDYSTGLSLDRNEFLSAAFVEGRLFTGSSGGFAYRVTNNDWRIFKANLDRRRHDLAVARTHQNSNLSGNWVVALDIQSHNADTVVWAACRRVTDTTDTIDQQNGVSFSTDFGATWQQALPELQVWNFAFDRNGVAYAAATEGLYFAEPPWSSWTRAAIIDPVTRDTIASSTAIYSVEVVDTVLWVGTELGLARRPIENPTGWEIVRIFKPTEAPDDVFAAPVPYSPLNNSGRLTIHYRVTSPCDVTVRIYDFAMDLVKTITDGRSRTAPGDYFESWDGYNESGDMVATGFYYFKVSCSTGEEYWGRLAIIP